MAQEIFKFGLGAVVVDNVTTLEGVIVGCCKYLNGCVQYDVQPQGLFEGKILPSLWVDEEQLVLTGKNHYLVIDEEEMDEGELPPGSLLPPLRQGAPYA